MANDMSATVPEGPVRSRVRSETEWRALMAEFERWDGTQVSFRGAGGGVDQDFPELAPLPGPDRRGSGREPERMPGPNPVRQDRQWSTGASSYQ